MAFGHTLRYINICNVQPYKALRPEPRCNRLAFVEAGYFFVQAFRQAVDTDFVRHCPQIHLGQDLVGEGVAHDERGMAGRATQVYQAAFCQQEDGVACRERVLVNLRFDVGVLDVRIVH